MLTLQRRGRPRRLSFLAEAIQPHDLGALARLRRLFGLLAGRRGNGGCRGGNGECGRGSRQIRRRRRIACRRTVDRLELQPELYRGIEEALDRTEWNGQPLWNAAERQSDLEAIFRNLEVPELVLQDDCHLLRILREQPRRQLDALGPGQKGDEEMVFARQAMRGGVGQYPPQHATQRVARQY